MNVGSLFSGIGGFDLGLERAGFTTAWFCEQDEFCQHVLAQHWPGVPCYPDITQLRGCDVEPVDVLCGGFPCQDLSVAGKGAGLDGARSGLWSEYARLIGELRPRYVLVENVSALLARGMGRVLGDLAALGYDAEWDCIPASAVGAPHRRDRVWIVAYPNADGGGRGFDGERDGAQAQPRLEASLGDNADGLRPAAGEVSDHDDTGPRAEQQPGGERAEVSIARDRRSLADANGAGFQLVSQGEARRGIEGSGERVDPAARGGDQPGGSAAEWWAVEPDVGRVAHGVPARVDRLRSLGNALVPQIAEWIGHRVMGYEEAA